jgi:RNA polymerase sigma factor for flagellar operon FliA
VTERERLVRRFLPLVKRMAKRVGRLVACVELGDLIGDGSIGLLRAIDSFDPSRGIELERYARHLVLGAMLNGIRRMDPVSERARRLVRLGDRTRYERESDAGGLPSLREIEAIHPGYVRALAASRRGQPLSLDAPLPLGESMKLEWGGDPARICERKIESDRFEALLDALTPRQRRVVLEHYYARRSLRSIGQSMAISPQRASQLHLTALSKLRRQYDVAAG